MLTIKSNDERAKEVSQPLEKEVVRTIKLLGCPEEREIKQKVKFSREAIINEDAFVDGKIEVTNYSEWKVEKGQTNFFPRYEAPTIDGFKPSRTGVSPRQVSADDNNVVEEIIYTKIHKHRKYNRKRTAPVVKRDVDLFAQAQSAVQESESLKKEVPKQEEVTPTPAVENMVEPLKPKVNSYQEKLYLSKLSKNKKVKKAQIIPFGVLTSFLNSNQEVRKLSDAVKLSGEERLIREAWEIEFFDNTF